MRSTEMAVGMHIKENMVEKSMNLVFKFIYLLRLLYTHIVSSLHFLPPNSYISLLSLFRIHEYFFKVNCYIYILNYMIQNHNLLSLCNATPTHVFRANQLVLDYQLVCSFLGKTMYPVLKCR